MVATQCFQLQDNVEQFGPLCPGETSATEERQSSGRSTFLQHRRLRKGYDLSKSHGVIVAGDIEHGPKDRLHQRN